MCGVSGVEFAVILVVAVIFLGPDRLPDMMRSLGKLARELRKITDEFSDVRDDFTREITKEVDSVSGKKTSPSQASTAARRQHAGRAGQDVADIDRIRASKETSTDQVPQDAKSDDPAQPEMANVPPSQESIDALASTPSAIQIKPRSTAVSIDDQVDTDAPGDDA